MRAAVLALAVAAATLIAGCEDGPYGAPYGDFFCGAQSCEITTHYCVLSPGDAGGTEAAVCAVLPDACSGVPACACVTSTCGGTCQAGSDGSVTLTCPH